jgi:hypothetical protein
MIHDTFRQDGLEFAENYVFIRERFVVLLGQADELVVLIRPKIRVCRSVRHLVLLVWVREFEMSQVLRAKEVNQ